MYSFVGDKWAYGVSEGCSEMFYIIIQAALAIENFPTKVADLQPETLCLKRDSSMRKFFRTVSLLETSGNWSFSLCLVKLIIQKLYQKLFATQPLQTASWSAFVLKAYMRALIRNEWKLRSNIMNVSLSKSKSTNIFFWALSKTHSKIQLFGTHCGEAI